MSLENVRAHWRFLAKVVVVFLLVIIGGPVAMAAFFWLVLGSVDLSGDGGILLMVGAFVVFVLGWMALVLWLGDRSDKRAGLDGGERPEKVLG